ncbi:MAG: SurA N-terminal domain-containing protein [Alphaproteobacteria bacterium]|nr:SurA N-terminal domain-containing protein [Alphaproteobacteria bacterium]
MLQSLSKFAAGIIGGILFLVLIASFALWGLGDVLRVEGGGTVVATVSKQEITAEDVERALIANNGDTDLSPELRGIFASFILQGLVSEALMAEHARSAGVELTPQDAPRLVFSLFQTPEGTFDEAAFSSFLLNNQSTAEAYYTQVAELLTASTLSTALAPPPAANGQAVQRQTDYKAQLITGYAQRAFVDRTLPLPAATTAALEAHLQENQQRFTVPELRTGRFFIIDRADIAASIVVPDDSVNAYFQDNASRYNIPERREWRQLFAAAEQEVALQIDDEEAYTSFGLLERRDILDDALAGAVFDQLDPGQSQTIQGDLGWYHIALLRVEPASVPTIDDVRDQITTQLAEEMATTLFNEVVQVMEENVLINATLDDVFAQALAGVPELSALDAAGDRRVAIARFDQIRADGLSAESLPAIELSEELRRSIFAIDEGLQSELVEEGDTVAAFTVDRVSPPALPPLDAIAPLVRAHHAEQRYREATYQALASRPVPATADPALGDPITLQATPLPSVQPGGAVNVPSEVQQFFVANGDGAAVIRTADDETWIVSLASKTTASDPVLIDSIVNTESAALQQAVTSEWVRVLETAARAEHDVEVDQDALSQYFSGESDVASH